MVYVISKDGQPLMPTTRYGKVRRLLKSKQAKVINRCPLTIKLLYETTSFVQETNLGVDTGSKHAGFVVYTKNLTERFHLLRWDMNVKTVYI